MNKHLSKSIMSESTKSIEELDKLIDNVEFCYKFITKKVRIYLFKLRREKLFGIKKKE